MERLCGDGGTAEGRVGNGQEGTGDAGLTDWGIGSPLSPDASMLPFAMLND